MSNELFSPVETKPTLPVGQIVTGAVLIVIGVGWLLSALDAAGLVGILSHPERNQGILARRAVLAPLVDAGCLLQVTAGSFVGTFGPHVKAFSEWLLGRGLVHFIATDAHGVKSRRPLMRRAFDREPNWRGIGRRAKSAAKTRRPW